MIILQKFWNHIRETEGIDIALYMTYGFIFFMLLILAVVIIWGLIELLGIYVVLVPFVVVTGLLILYGVGRFIGNRFDLM